jgi:hypothetical protein
MTFTTSRNRRVSIHHILDILLYLTIYDSLHTAFSICKTCGR